jgi:hypothetical protein
MSGTLIAFIIITAIIGGYLIDYQKNKLKWQSKNQQSDTEIEKLQIDIEKMRKRIENLEAIVADDAYSGRESAASSFSIEIEDQESIKDQNQKTVANKAKMKGE